MLVDIVAHLLSLAWTLLVVAWTIFASLSHRRWFGDERNPVTVAGWIMIALAFFWGVSVTPAVVSYTMAL